MAPFLPQAPTLASERRCFAATRGMRRSRAMRSTARVCFAIGALLFTMAGCAEERPPINRVQSDALAKSFFVGDSLSDTSDDPEFYWRNYVIDGSASQS